MGFFGDLKADFAQAVDELTDSEAAESAKKENAKRGFGKKNKKGAAVKTEPVHSAGFNYEPVGGEEPRSETEQALWDEIRADLTEPAKEEVPQPMQANDPITGDDVVEEIAEIEEAEQEISSFREEKVAMTNSNIAQAVAAPVRNTVNYVMPQSDPTDEVGIITAGMTVIGNIYNTGHLEIYGNVDGDIEVNGSVRVLGNVTGNVKCNEVILEAGKIKGNVSCASGITIATGCVVIGEIIAGSGAIIAGAVKGDIDVHGPVTLDTTAIVKGNIKSQSVQMASGAMVDGMCSQCYSEVDLSSYFENM